MSKLPPPPPPPPPGRGSAGGGPPRVPGDRRPGPPGDPNKRAGGWPRWAIYLLAGVLVLGLLVPSMWPRDEGEKITYTDFMALVRADKVDEIDISASGNISG